MPRIMPLKSLAYNVYNEYIGQQKSLDSLGIKALVDNNELIGRLFGGEGVRLSNVHYSLLPSIKINISNVKQHVTN